MMPKALHFLQAIGFAISFFAARLLLDVLIFKPLALALFGRGADDDSDSMRSRIVKFCESMWKLTYYASMQLWVLSIMLRSSWWRNAEEYFVGWPNQEIDSSMGIFYLCQCGFYLFSIASLVTWETRRKDFSIMMSHHVITSILIGSSFFAGLYRIGTITLAIHDTTDVLIEVAKIFKYSENERGADVCFGLFAISWLVLRLIIFPFWIIKASSYDLLHVVENFPPTLYYAFNMMLLALLVLHIYWWKLTCAMIWKQISNKEKVG